MSKHDVKESAKQVRKVLKSNYPSIKFSVRISRFAGGSSVEVSWTDGPTQHQVDELTAHLKGWDNGYCNEYISTYRSHSPEVMQAAAITAGIFFGIPTPTIDASGKPYCTDYTQVESEGRNEAICDLVHRACWKTSIYGVYLETAFQGAFAT